MRPEESELATASPRVLPAPTRLARLNLAVVSSLLGARSTRSVPHHSRSRSGDLDCARQLSRTFASRNAAA
jgi:hypothetical protein